MFGIFKKRSAGPLTLEQKLAILADCGLKLSSEFTGSDLLDSWSRERYEEPGFTMVLVGLGTTEEQSPWRSHCINVWHFDTECIEDEGSYVRIAERLTELTQGGLVITKVRDRVDLEKGIANLTFEYGGRSVHTDFQVNDDWVDPAVFSLFVRLLAQSDPSRIFLYQDLQGQDCVIACVTQDQFVALSKAGATFEVLK